MKITAETEDEEIEADIASSTARADIRAGDARQRRLERNVRRQSRNWGTALSLDPELPTACVKAEADKDPSVLVTAREVAQPVTDYDGRQWDWLVQRAFGVHEVGHIRYTDFEAIEDLLSGYDSSDMGFAKAVENALEDGAIEKQIVNRWPNYFEVLRTLRANVFESVDQGIVDPERGGYIYPLAQAINAAILDLWAREVYDLNLGILDPLLDEDDDEHHFRSQNDFEIFRDEAIPIIEEGIEWTLSEPDPEHRAQLIFDTVDRLIPLLDDADADGRPQADTDGDGQDAGGFPDDANDNHDNTEPIDASELDGEIDIEITDDVDGSGQPIENLDPDQIGDVSVDPDIETQAAEDVADDAREEAGIGEEVIAELEEIRDTLKDSDGASDEPLKSREINVPTGKADYNPARLDTARQAARPLERILRSRLQKERRTDIQRQRRRGRVDSTALHRTRVGEKEVMMRRTQPDEKDYHCAIVVDRSGSMGGSKIDGAEEAVGMLTLALEAVGVDTMVVDLYHGKLHLANPFGAEAENRPGRLFDGRSRGGTPLDEALEVVRARFEREPASNRFMFVITDGEPGNPSAFEREIQRCNFPVVGITLRSSGSGAGDGVYHRNVTADPTSDLQDALTGLLNEVMF